MSDIVIRLAILLGVCFGFLAALGESAYLAIAVFKLPLLVIVLAGLIASFLAVSFLFFVGNVSPVREGRRYE
ncbi:hypothetical protein [uncultured Rhodoblastus sp.]|uniref:hypothetical protein n=1 Tax=uncultured Rhodoblastus sp. TaxID=543037 RepID=UPI0025FB619A|nr:hypothetical protein [uncultured Rhodoblastus sp.]